MRRHSKPTLPALGPHSTQWTELRLAAQARGGDNLEARDALQTFCQRYWNVVYSTIRLRRSESAAHDLTQEFFLTYLIERDNLSRLDPARGSFRGWLWTALQRFLLDDYRRRTRQRSDERAECPLDVAAPLAAAEDVRNYEYYYARNLAERSALELHARWAPRLARRGVDVDQSTLLGWLIERNAGAVAQRLGVQADNARQVLRRLHVDLWKLLAAEVAQTVADRAEAQAELTAICGVLGIEPPSLDAHPA